MMIGQSSDEGDSLNYSFCTSLTIPVLFASAGIWSCLM
jgi:hypothetical protein